MNRTIRATVKGQRLTLNTDEVLSILRQAIRDGLPHEASRYKDVAVEVEGQRVGVKWAFSHVTGIPPSKFQTQQAEYVLGERLGLPIIRGDRPDSSSGNQKRIHRTQATHTVSQQQIILFERQVAEIRGFLNGVSLRRPSDEQLCDWVHFCYSFEMYSEGSELFALVSSGDVNPWYLERTRKLARICAVKAKQNG